MSQWLAAAQRGQKLLESGPKRTASQIPSMQAQPQQPYLYGLGASTLSAIPEFFGADPAAAASQFRNENPVAGFVSQVIPTLVPYVGAARAAQGTNIGRSLLSKVDKAVDPIARPWLNSAAKVMAVEATFVEAPRMAIGAVLYPENKGELFADVGLSLALGGGLGMVGGMLRTQGRAAKEADLLVKDAPIVAAPAVQLDMALKGSELNDPTGLGRDAILKTLQRDVFEETIGAGKVSKADAEARGQSYLQPLLKGNQEDRQALNYLQKPSKQSEGGKTSGLKRLFLTETDNAADAHIMTGDMAEILSTVGAKDATDLARRTFHPRVVQVLDSKGAGHLAKDLDRQVWDKVEDGVLMAREEGNGLYLVARRLPPKAVDAAPKKGEQGTLNLEGEFGKQKVFAGDRWLITKTNDPAFFAKSKAKVMEANYSQWATWRKAFQPVVGENSMFKQADDLLLWNVSPLDLANMQKLDRKTWISQKGADLTRKLTNEVGVSNSVAGRAMAENIYDVIAPTMLKQGKNSLYQRFEGLMRNRIRTGETFVSKRFFGKSNIAKAGIKHVHRPETVAMDGLGTWVEHFRSIPDEDLATWWKAAQSRTPAEEIAKWAEGGIVSQRTIDATKAMQAIDQDIIQNAVLPELKGLGEKYQLNALEGYLVPRFRAGDTHQIIRDEAGKTVWLLTGKNGLQTSKQAEKILEEAAANGKKWTASKAELFNSYNKDEKDLTKLMEEVGIRIGKDDVADKIIEDAMKKLNYIGAERKAGFAKQAPGAFKSRTGVQGSNDIEMPTRQEIEKAAFAHYKQLVNFSSMQGYMERFGDELTRFQGKGNETLFNDLVRKRNQYLGVEGQITNALNGALTPVLGHLMGAKAATKIAAVTNQTMWAFNLGIVQPTFALLNALSPLMTALPHISFVLNASPARMANMMQSVPIADAQGRVTGFMSHLSAPKILWQAFKDLGGEMSEAQRSTLEKLTDDGTLHPALFEEHIQKGARGPQSLKESFQSGGFVRYAYDASTYMARKSEEFARVVSANAGYRLGEGMGYQGEQLLNFTRRFVETTNYMYGVVDRPRVFTGPLGSIFGLFKNWQFHYLGMMANYAGLAYKENVWSPLMWQGASALALGGLGATPLRHMADGLTNWHENEPDSYKWMKENWKDSADEIWFGLPAFLGVSLQASSSIPGTDVRNEITGLGNMVAWERAKQLGTALASANQQWDATGRNPLENANVRDKLIAAALPRFVNRINSSVEGDYVKSGTTGYPMVRDVSLFSRLMHGSGMNTTEIEAHQIAGRHLYKEQEKDRAMQTALGEAFAQAHLRGDAETTNQIFLRAMALNIPADKLRKSAMNFMRREEESDLLSRYSKQRAAEWREALAEPK